MENWPKGTQPKRSSEADRRSGRGIEPSGWRPGTGVGTGVGVGTGTGLGTGTGDEVVWPEAAGRTGAVPRTERDLGVPRQPSASGRESGRGWGRESGPESGPESGRAAGSGSGTPIASAPWERPDQPGHNHDPHEVTVQLDGAGRELGEGGTVERGGKDGAGSQDSDRPVFVDESGRRRNRYRRLGIAVGTTCAAYAVVIVGTLMSGNSDAPWLPVPMQKDDKPAAKVDTPPLPAESADRSDTVADGGSPGGGAGSAGTGATPSPGTRSPEGKPSGKSDGRSGDAKAPGASTSPKPSAGTSTSPGPKPKPSESVKVPESSASASEPPGGGPSPSGTASPAPSDSGGPAAAPASGSDTDTVADGPPSPEPVEPPSNTSTPSPENPA